LGFFGAYAAGQLINGVLGDRFNLRYFISIGLFFAGISNILFGITHNLNAMILFWTINGYFQSMLWGPLVRIISDSTPKNHLQKAILLLSSSTIIGYLFSYIVVGRIAIAVGWKMSFFIPGILLIIMAGIWFWKFRFYRYPQEPSFRRGRSAKREVPLRKAAIKKIPKEERLYSSENVLRFLIRTRLWVTALVCVLQGSIKEGLILWGPAFFSESLSLPMGRILFIMALVPLMNFAGLLFGALVNKLFRFQEKYTILFFLSVALFFLILMAASKGNFIMVILVFCCILGPFFAVNNILVAFVPLNFQREDRISSTAGFLDCAIYIGAAISSPLAGMLADQFGWNGVIKGWIGVCVAAIILAAVSRNYSKKRNF
jgi:OPA family glycerol-3-phosphate transporter-like MFS transporter